MESMPGFHMKYLSDSDLQFLNASVDLGKGFDFFSTSFTEAFFY